MLMEMYDVILTNPFPLWAKISTTSFVARMFKAMGYTRKFAFYLREAAILYHKNNSPRATHVLMAYLAPHYQLSQVALDMGRDINTLISTNIQVKKTHSVDTPKFFRESNNRNLLKSPQKVTEKQLQEELRLVAHRAQVAEKRFFKDRRKRDWPYLQKIILVNLIQTAKSINGIPCFT
jgi:hypothetical protein